MTRPETSTSVATKGAEALAGSKPSRVSPNGSIEPVRAAELTASAFGVARIRPLLGPPIVESDELPGAARVAVIGHALWQRRFQGDPRIVGRLVRMGGEQTTVVGVMPDGFAFPAAQEVCMGAVAPAIAGSSGDRSGAARVWTALGGRDGRAGAG